MPRGDKSAYTDKQQRQAAHIEASEKQQGRSTEDAERIAWATVNKQDGGGKRSGSGRKVAKTSARKPAAKNAARTSTTKKAAQKTAVKKSTRSSAAKRTSH